MHFLKDFEELLEEIFFPFPLEDDTLLALEEDLDALDPVDDKVVEPTEAVEFVDDEISSFPLKTLSVEVPLSSPQAAKAKVRNKITRKLITPLGMAEEVNSLKDGRDILLGNIFFTTRSPNYS